MLYTIFKLILVTIFGLFIVNCGGFQSATIYQDPTRGKAVNVAPAIQEGQGTKALQEVRKVFVFSNPSVKVNLEKNQVDFTVTTRWNNQVEDVHLVGKLGAEDLAWLSDTQTTKNGKHRLKGLAKCLPRSDKKRCAELFVDVFYAIHGIVYREQFPLVEPILSNRSKELITQLDQSDSKSNSSATASAAPAAEQDYDETEESTEITAEDHGSESETFEGGVYVGATPSKEFINEILDHDTNVGSGNTSPAKPTTGGLVEKIENAISGQSMILDPFMPIAPTTNPPEITPSASSSLELQDLLNEKIKTENVIRYNLNYTEGGKSVRYPWAGMIEHGGTIMPTTGPGFRRIGPPTKSVASGFAVSLIEQAASDFTAQNPQCGPLLLNHMSKKNGGVLRFENPQPNGKVAHDSHQNGTEADIGYLPYQTFRSVLGRGGILSTSFNYECNLGFWKHLYRVQLKDNNTALSRIFVHRGVKAGICKWYKGKKITDEDKEVLRRIQPWQGHYKHFHLRLNCSPDHVGCLNDVAIPEKTGCGF